MRVICVSVHVFVCGRKFHASRYYMQQSCSVFILDHVTLHRNVFISEIPFLVLILHICYIWIFVLSLQKTKYFRPLFFWSLALFHMFFFSSSYFMWSRGERVNKCYNFYYFISIIRFYLPKFYWIETNFFDISTIHSCVCVYGNFIVYLTSTSMMNQFRSIKFLSLCFLSFVSIFCVFLVQILLFTYILHSKSF